MPMILNVELSSLLYGLFSPKAPAAAVSFCVATLINRMYDGQLRTYPLKQLVLSHTRAQAALDKIYSNIDHWYNQPIILPSVGNSDHDSVLFMPKGKPPTRKRHVITTRSSNPNGKVLYEALRGFNWINLYRLPIHVMKWSSISTLFCIR